MSIIKKLFDSGYKEFKRCQKVAKQVFALEEEFKALPDQDAIIAKTNEFKYLEKSTSSNNSSI